MAKSHHVRQLELAKTPLARRRHERAAVRRGRQGQWLLRFLFFSYLVRDASLGEAKLVEVLILPLPA
jgi:hypothetical protein